MACCRVIHLPLNKAPPCTNEWNGVDSLSLIELYEKNMRVQNNVISQFDLFSYFLSTQQLHVDPIQNLEIWFLKSSPCFPQVLDTSPAKRFHPYKAVWIQRLLPLKEARCFSVTILCGHCNATNSLSKKARSMTVVLSMVSQKHWLLQSQVLG